MTCGSTPSAPSSSVSGLWILIPRWGIQGKGHSSGSLSLSLSAVWGFLGLVVAVGPSHGDEQRKHQRSGIVLEEGRRVTETTANVRGLLFQNFLGWLSDQGVDFDDLVMPSPPDVDRINKVLVQYGKWLFSEGKPYYHLSETINLVTSKRPVIRRSLQQAWDLC